MLFRNMTAPSKADYLKRYLSGADAADDGKKKKRKKDKKDKKSERHKGMVIYEDDAFASVSAGQAREVSSDEEEEEKKIQEDVQQRMEVAPKFKSAFVPVDSPPPIIKRSDSPDQSPARNRQRHDSDDDNSPPKRQQQGKDNGVSQRRKRHDSDDNSPPRHKPRQRHDSDDNSPPRRRVRHDSDQSPPRTSGSRRRHDSDASPPRKRERHDSDNSPVRRGRAGSPDQSPPRRTRRDSDASPPRRPANGRFPEQRGRRVASPTVDTTQRTLDGKVAGLQSAKDLKSEAEKLKLREAEMFEEMDVATSGRGATTVVREKQIRRGRDRPEDKEKKEREAKKQVELVEKFKDWNKGVKQLEERKAQIEEMARVVAEPLARAADDEEMNRHLREVLREEDPMASVITRKHRDDAIDRGEFVYPTYNKPWNPNRFGIRPGYRWDGVDRSNGFEGRLAVAGNKKKAEEAEFYQNIALFD